MTPGSSQSLAARRRICGTCKREIFWRLHAVTGKAAPIDGQPTADGTIVLPDGDTYRVLTKPERTVVDDVPRYTSHFATCPSAASHRRP